MSWTADLFWDAFAINGMLSQCRYQSPSGGRVVKTIWVGYSEPDRQMLDGISKQYEIEYQLADMPLLKEGDELVVNVRGTWTRFKVREPAYVSDVGSRGGEFRFAVLTKL